MLQFKQTDTSTRILLTLTELSTLPNPFYLFVFTHVVTKDIVLFVKSTDDDFSNYPDRYNEYEIDPSVLFAGKDVGEWHYTIYEQDNINNTEIANTIGVVEKGKLYLKRDSEFSYITYNQSVTFKTYNG